MSISKIEWLRDPITGKKGYSINPVKGRCPNPDCPLGEDCYGRTLYKRFGWNPEIRFYEPAITYLPSKPSKIFVGSTMDLFGDWVKPEWLEKIFWRIEYVYDRHTFIFLTKKLENLKHWSPFPLNCWIGISICGVPEMPTHRIYNGYDRIEATIKFISFEPLLGQTKLDYRDLIWTKTNWIILGGRSGSHKFYPPEEWIKEIEDAADKVGIPVFEKDNLRKDKTIKPRQEWPKRR